MAIIDVIKYEGGNNVLVWKHVKEDFNTSAQLIVHESQEAVIFKDGQASEPYRAGKHTIQTENIPGIRRVVGLVTGGVSPNHYEVYYINKAYSMDIGWGTATPWVIQDPTIQMPISIRAHGQFAVRVADSRQLLVKLVGTTTSFSKYSLSHYFRGIFTSYIKDFISNLILDEGMSVNELSSKLIHISESVSPKLACVLAKYGLSLEEFIVESISIVEDADYMSVKAAMATRAKNIITGVTEQEKMGHDVAKTQAGNPGTGGQMAQMMAGIAAGASVAQPIGNIMRNITQPLNNSISAQGNQKPDQFSMGTVNRSKSPKNVDTASVQCKSCGATLAAGSRFCNICGTPVEGKRSVNCPACGALLPENSKFCSSCGSKI